VIAIIAILASMLLPALSQARETARKINCTGQVKQLTTYMLMYTNDYKEHMPFCNSTTATNSYCGYLNPFSEQYVGYNYEKITKGTSIYKCPSTRKRDPNTTGTFYHISYGYNYNVGYRAATNMLSAHSNPSGTVMLIEKGWDSGSSGYPWYAGAPWKDTIMQTYRLGARHGDSGNRSFLDGHVVSSKQLPSIDTTDVFWGYKAP
jgi:prepilin-type processing-associated H-X9-DG protein